MGLKATDFADCPTTKGELAWWLEAAFASDPRPVPRGKSPLRAAIRAMVARE